MHSFDAIASETLAAAGLLLRQMLAALGLAVTAYVAGRTLLGVLGPPELARGRGPGAAGPSGTVDGRLGPGGAVERVALATTLGLAAVAQVGLALGLAGLLEPGPELLALASIHLASLPAWRSLAGSVAGAAKRHGEARGRGAPVEPGEPAEPGERPHPRPGRSRPWLVGTIVAVLPISILTLYPPIAFDATLYHLPYARAFAATGALPFLPGLRIPIFPQLIETLFAVLMPFAGDQATQVVALLATLLTAASILVWGRRYSKAAGWVAVAAYAGSPLVIYLAATAYVEPGLVLFTTAAFHCAARWRASGEAGWLTLAALFAGAAASTKYLGLFALVVVAAAALSARPADSLASSWWRRLGRVALAGGLVIAPWYGRIVAATGNPIFPFLPEVFGSSAWNPTSFRSPRALPAVLQDLPVWLVRLPWDAVFARGRLGGYPPYSAVFLLALPALLAGALARRRVRALLVVAAAYAVVVLAFLPDARYLLVALPLVCLAVGDTAAWSLAWLAAAKSRGRAKPGPPSPEEGTTDPTAARSASGSLASGARRARVAWLAGAERRLPAANRRVNTWAGWLALAIFLPGWTYSLYSLYRLGPVPVTLAKREAFVTRALPALPSIRYLDHLCGSSYTLYAIHAENMLYFAAGRFLGDWTGPAAYQLVIPPDGDADRLFRRLRAIGADHLLTVEGDRALPPLFTPRFDRLFRLVYADGHTRLYALDGATCGPRS